MTLRVTTAPTVAANTPFVLLVPGQQVWQLLAVRAVLSRAVGGTPTRAMQLTVSDQTATYITSPAADAGTEPGTLSVTWTNAQPSAVSSGTTGVTVAPLPPLTLYPGYTLTGTVINGTVTDRWTSAVAWWDDGIEIRA